MTMTRSINLTVHVDEKRRVLIDLPEDVPTGPVELEVVIHTPERSSDQPSARETFRARMIAAGLMNPDAHYAPPDAEELSPEEEERIGRMLAGDRPVEDLINEEREERF